MNAIRPPRNPRLRLVTLIPPPPPIPGAMAYKRAKRSVLTTCAFGWLVSAATLQFMVGVVATVVCGIVAMVLERNERNLLRDPESLRSLEP